MFRIDSNIRFKIDLPEMGPLGTLYKNDITTWYLYTYTLYALDNNHRDY